METFGTSMSGVIRWYKGRYEYCCKTELSIFAI